MKGTEPRRRWSTGYLCVSFAVLILCLGLAGISLVQRRGQVALADVALIALAFAPFFLVQFLPRRSGQADELARVAKRAARDREHAEEAARVARVQCGLISALSMVWGGYDMVYKHGRVLLRLASADRAVGIDTYIELLDVGDDIGEDMMEAWRENLIEHVGFIAREAIVDLRDDPDRGLRVRVVPGLTSAVRTAFAHYEAPARVPNAPEKVS